MGSLELLKISCNQESYERWPISCGQQNGKMPTSGLRVVLFLLSCSFHGFLFDLLLLGLTRFLKIDACRYRMPNAAVDKPAVLRFELGQSLILFLLG